nr:reverse transcriptase domain, viral movement protein [Tanacetum cinerariifolium]
MMILIQKGDSDFGVHMINPIPHVLPIQEDPPLPLAKIHLLTDAYAKPIPVIAFFDTGSSVSILNPNIVPNHYWKPHHQSFMAANGEKFVIDKISVPINIRLFPKCVIKRRLLGSSSHGKDLLIGFDILHKLPKLTWSSEGLYYRSFFNPWTAMHRLFALNQVEPVDVSDLESLYSLDDEPSDSVLCTITYSERSSDDDSDTDSLEGDFDFCVHMINPIPHILPIQEDPSLPLAKIHLLTDAYAKPIPVIAFFDTADDKFPLPQKKSLFQNLADAKVLSKFDLKSGFWQLGSNHTVWLFPMLKKNPPQWTSRQTEAVKAI